MSCEACRTIPPVVAEGYTPRGNYETLAGLNTYITGPPTATTGIIDAYDVFGFSSQTIQGADILATALNAVVLVPDFFKGVYAQHEWIPPNTDEKREAFTKFMTEQAAIPQNVETLLQLIKDIKTKFSSVTSWGAVGLCWGGKVVALASGPDTPFAASGQVHPGLLEKADAEKLSIPHIVLASKDEPADAVADYAKIIEKNGKGGVVETYDTMWHGWMGARANLDSEESRNEYTRGYTQLAEFFGKTL